MCRQYRREHSRVRSPNGRNAAFQRIVMELRFRRLHLMTLVMFLVVPALISCDTGQTPATPHIPPSATVIPPVAPQSATPAPLASRIDVLDDCLQTIDVSTHFHVQLTITLHGRILPIPSGIGIDRGCFNRIHTHAGSGVIHVEHAISESFTLEDFFLVGQRSEEFNPLAGRRVIRVLVDGKQYPFDYLTIPLRDGLDVRLDLVRQISARRTEGGGKILARRSSIRHVNLSRYD